MKTTIDVKYTPGPWGICVNSSRDVDIAGDMVCDLRGCQHADANAALIAAAPDLLDALQMMMTFEVVIRENRPSAVYTIENARAAIAKATDV